jgi:CDP-glycerol glycerophosphotransferase (TagB/SpsB family)
LSSNSKYSLHLVGDFRNHYNANYYASGKHLPYHKKYSLFICADIARPWKIDAKSVYFCHGIGPKLDYVSNQEFGKFDYCLCPCKPIFDVQSTINQNCHKIGLPILEAKSGVSKRAIIEKFSLNKDKPTILYAPSWHGNANLISDVKTIVIKLSELEGYNLILSPHPNLLRPDLCDGRDLLKDIKGVNMNVGGIISSLDILKEVADILVSDISSMLFEAMALEKRAVFDGNEAIYIAAKAGHVLDDLKHNITTCDWSADLNKQIDDVMKKNDLIACQNVYIQDYVYNLGKSKQAFLDFIEEAS